jgi:hypothetical protein
MDERDDVRRDLSDEELALNELAKTSEFELSKLEEELKGIDVERAQLAERSGQYEALGAVCRSLEQLEDLGGTDLFWKSETGDVTEYIDEARNRIHEFGTETAEVETRRNKILNKIGKQNDALDCLHYELVDAMEREESRRAEWVVEREAEELPAREMVMPWQRGQEEDRRYRQSLLSSLVVALVLGGLIASIAIPIPDREKLTELPERVTQLVYDQRPPPAPKPEPFVDEEIPEPDPQEPDPVEELPDEIVPEAAEQPMLAETQEPDIKEQVKSRGILAFRDSFASSSALRPTTQLGSQARVSNAGEDAVGRPTRAMVTTNAPGSSGGINLASISRDVGGGGPGMGGVSVSRVASSIGGGEGFGDRPLSGGGLAGRTDEEIQIVFDRYKAALYRLYNRELRKDPTLRGQIVIKLTIEPDGSVSFCALQSMDMNAPALADQVVSRVATFDFGAKEDIAAVTIIYPIDFLPAA